MDNTHKLSFNDVCKEIYPLTIISDRYDGVYSNGKYTAWNCDTDCVPVGVFSDDDWCFETWNKIREREKWFRIDYGVGETIEDAVFDLYSKLNLKQKYGLMR